MSWFQRANKEDAHLFLFIDHTIDLSPLHSQQFSQDVGKLIEKK